MMEQNLTDSPRPVESAAPKSQAVAQSVWDRVPLVRSLRTFPWRKWIRVYQEVLDYAYEQTLGPYDPHFSWLHWTKGIEKKDELKQGYISYRLRRFCWIPLGLTLSFAATAQTGRYPLASYYEQGFIDREQPLPREGLTYSRMMDHLQVGLPLKDRIRLDLRTEEGLRKLACQFRFGANYEALAQQLQGAGLFGPDTLQNPPMGILYQWFDPDAGIQVSLGYRGGVAANGVANYRYEVLPMDAVTRSRFYLGQAGEWQRLPIIGETVQTPPVATFYDQYRTLRDDVRVADSLAVYMVAPAVSGRIELRLNIPRRDLPAKGQVYYTPRRSEAFPFGFLGKVTQVKREGNKQVILFEEARELDLFDVHSGRNGASR